MAGLNQPLHPVCLLSAGFLLLYTINVETIVYEIFFHFFVSSNHTQSSSVYTVTLLGILISSHPVPPIEFIMTQYSTHKKNKDEWYSPLFYTGPEGYKMCIEVKANTWKGYMSVLVYLMGGDYDSMLKWPFKGEITIQLVNHNDDQVHFVLIVDVNNTQLGRRVTIGEKNYTGGTYEFITPTTVESSTETRRYLDNDCLTFRVTNVVVRSV